MALHICDLARLVCDGGHGVSDILHDSIKDSKEMDGQLSLGTVIMLVTVFIRTFSFPDIIRLLGRNTPKLIEYKHVFANTI